MTQDEINAFWFDAAVRAGLNPARSYMGPNAADTLPPNVWAFGATPEQADELLALVLAGTKTATAGALWDYEAEDVALPEPGDLSIVLDGEGHPQALLRTTSVTVTPFDQVDEEHARLEGEGDRTLAHWRDVHRRFFTDHATHDRGFSEDMPVVCERFEVLATR